MNCHCAIKLFSCSFFLPQKYNMLFNEVIVVACELKLNVRTFSKFGANTCFPNTF